jgi:hypothetical protein
MKNKIILILFFALLLFNEHIDTARAMPVNDFATEFQTANTTTATSASYAERLGTKALGILQANTIYLAKMVAAYAEQTLVKTLVGGSDGSNSTIIRDFNNYLYTAPQQQALTQLNSFFSSASQGRASSLNYEGVGTNYDAYLITQAKNSINGQSFVTDIQNQVTDPATDMFAGGNMKGIMSFLQCSNNPYCYTLAATEKYNSDFAKNQTIAKNENVNGFIPTKVNGRITNPAAIAQNALQQIDQLGTTISMNATNNGNPDETVSALLQIAEGTAISTAARLGNYGISDDAGKAAIRNSNDNFPFSLSYSSSSGLGVTGAGGNNLNTGIGSYSTSVQVGNTCATAGAGINASGGTSVMINGKKVQCP